MGNWSSKRRAAEIEVHVDRALRVKELENMVSELKLDNNNLRAELMQKFRQQENQRSTDVKKVSEVSSAQIAVFVDNMLATPESNLSYVPDFIERPLEVRTITYLLNAMAHTIDSAKLEFMGHEIVMRIQPKTESPVASAALTSIQPSERKKLTKALNGDQGDDQYSSYSDEELGVTRTQSMVGLPPAIDITTAVANVK